MPNSPYRLYDSQDFEVYYEGKPAKIDMENSDDFDGIKRKYPHFRVIIKQGGKTLYTTLSSIYFPKTVSNVPDYKRKALKTSSVETKIAFLDLVNLNLFKETDNKKCRPENLFTDIDIVGDIFLNAISEGVLDRFNIIRIHEKLKRLNELFLKLKNICPTAYHFDIDDIYSNLLTPLLSNFEQARNGGKIN